MCAGRSRCGRSDRINRWSRTNSIGHDEHLQEGRLLRAVPTLHVRGRQKISYFHGSGKLRPVTAVKIEKVHTAGSECRVLPY